jgi:hypothetical protein
VQYLCEQLARARAVQDGYVEPMPAPSKVTRL